MVTQSVITARARAYFRPESGKYFSIIRNAVIKALKKTAKRAGYMPWCKKIGKKTPCCMET